MLVVDVTEFYSPRGGVRRYLDAKGRALAEAGHRHLVVSGGERDDERLLYGGRDGGFSRLVTVRGPRLPYDPNYHLMWRLGALLDTVESRTPDVLEVHSLYVAGLLLRAARRSRVGVRSVFWHSDFISAYVESHLTRWVGEALGARAVGPLWAWVRSVTRRADVVFVASESQRRKLAAHGVERLHSSPFGFERTVFHPERRDQAWRREILGPHADDPGHRIFIGVGRLALEKRYRVVVDGFCRYRELTGARATLVLLGDGPERAALERRCQGRDDVRFLGFEPAHERVARALASADLFVHGGPFETFGMSVAQALLCGTPALVPDAGAAAELVDSTCGAVYRADDPEALATALRGLGGGDWRSLRDGARTRAAGLPTEAQQARGVLDAYVQAARASVRPTANTVAVANAL